MGHGEGHGTRTQWWCRTVLGMAEAGMTAAEEEVFDAALAAHASQLEASGDAAAAASSGILPIFPQE